MEQKRFFFRLGQISQALLAAQLGLFALGVLVVALVTTFILQPGEGYAELGTMLSLAAMVMPPVLLSADTNLYLSMGRTRREVLAQSGIILLLTGLQGGAAAFLLGQLERWLYALLWPGLEAEITVISYMAWWWLPLIWAAMAAVLGLHYGCCSRLGPQSFGVLFMALGVGSMAISTGMDRAKEGCTGLLAGLGSILLGITPVMGLLLAALLVAAALAFGIWTLYRWPLGV